MKFNFVLTQNFTSGDIRNDSMDVINFQDFLVVYIEQLKNPKYLEHVEREITQEHNQNKITILIGKTKDVQFWHDYFKKLSPTLSYTLCYVDSENRSLSTPTAQYASVKGESFSEVVKQIVNPNQNVPKDAGNPHSFIVFDMQLNDKEADNRAMLYDVVKKLNDFRNQDYKIPDIIILFRDSNISSVQALNLIKQLCTLDIYGLSTCLASSYTLYDRRAGSENTPITFENLVNSSIKNNLFRLFINNITAIKKITKDEDLTQNHFTS